jgi:hypothetical protein
VPPPPHVGFGKLVQLAADQDDVLLSRAHGLFPSVRATLDDDRALGVAEDGIAGVFDEFSAGEKIGLALVWALRLRPGDATVFLADLEPSGLLVRQALDLRHVAEELRCRCLPHCFPCHFLASQIIFASTTFWG